MYSLILNSLFRLNLLNTPAERVQYLRSLQPAALDLRRAYNPDGMGHVRVDYRDPNIQAAYFIRYFPQYSQVIRQILPRLEDQRVIFPFDEEVRACFFGSGPGPEIYGFLQYLVASHGTVKTVSANSFDLLSDEWANSRSITTDRLIPTIWKDRQFSLISNTFDLTQGGSAYKLVDIIANSNIIVFQNCLNEIDRNRYSNVKGNVASIIKGMTPNSILLIVDLSSYPSVLVLLSEIQHLAECQDLTSVLIPCSAVKSRYDAQAIVDSIPSIIRQNLLTGVPYKNENGLIPRRYIDYHVLALRKN